MYIITLAEQLGMAKKLPEIKALIVASQAVWRVLCATCSFRYGGGCPGYCPEIVTLDAAIRELEEKS